MKKLVIIILTILLTFSCFAQEFVPFELPNEYQIDPIAPTEPTTPTTPTTPTISQIIDYAEHIELFVEKRYSSWEEIWDTPTFSACKPAFEKLRKSELEANILKYVNRLNHLSNYELLIAYTYAEVYLRKFLPLICY